MEKKDTLNVKSIKKEVEKGVSIKDKLRLKLKQKKLEKENKKKKKKEKPKINYRQFFSKYIERGGLKLKLPELKVWVLTITSIITAIVYLYLLANSFIKGIFSLPYFFLTTLITAPTIFAVSFVAVIILFVLYIDIQMFRRKTAIEIVLPDYLQLASANIRSGMTIDKALWFAIRPQFGVLSSEMEMVAKQTMTGSELDEALLEFSNKFDSPILHRAIHLIVEGVKAGGEIGDLLDRIATDLKESQSLKKEMSANVTSYVMFISFASIIAAPFMYGLSYQLTTITQSIIGGIDLGNSGSSMGLNLGGGGIALSDFFKFSLVNLTITSFFAACIISTIQKGDIKSGLKKIPAFIIITTIMFFIAVWALEKMFGSMF